MYHRPRHRPPTPPATPALSPRPPQPSTLNPHRQHAQPTQPTHTQHTQLTIPYDSSDSPASLPPALALQSIPTPPPAASVEAAVSADDVGLCLAPRTDGRLKKGSRVTVVGTSRADLNGLTCTVTQSHGDHDANPETERWQVLPDGPDGKVLALKKVNLVLIGAGPDQAVAEAGRGGGAKRAGGEDGKKGGKETGPEVGPTAEATPVPSAHPANDEKAAAGSGTSGTSGSSRAAASALGFAAATASAASAAGGDPKKKKGKRMGWAGADRPASRRVIRGSKKGSTPWGGGWGTLKPSPRVAEELARGPGCVHRCLDKFLAAHLRTKEITARRKCGLCMTTSKFALAWDLTILTLSILVVFVVVLRTYVSKDLGHMIT